MSTEPFIGEVKLLAFNFPPMGYQTCQGQSMPISENAALFSLIGVTYGGDGQVSFNLPDLQGRVPIGQGQGAGLPAYSIGEKEGSTSVTLTTPNLPQHIHTLNSMKVKLKANSTLADSQSATDSYPGTNSTNVWAETATPGAFMAADEAVVSGSTDPTGTNMPIDIMNPYIVMNYSIAIEGLFPSRN